MTFMGDRRGVGRCFVGGNEEKNQGAKPSHRSEFNIKMDIMFIGPCIILIAE